MTPKSLLFLAVAFSSLSAHAALIAQYEFEGNADSSVNSPAANGTLNSASISNAVPASPAGGSALDLNSNITPSGLVSNMTVNTGALTINGSYTVAMFIRVATNTTPTGGTGTIFGNYQTAGPFQHNYLLRLNATNGVNFITRDSDGSTAQMTSSDLTLGTWYHLAATFDSVTATATLYLNGASVGSQVMAGGTAGFGGFPAQTTTGAGGFNTTGTSRGIDGFLDSVRVYDEALTPAEIAALAVPEPSAALLGGLGVFALLRRRR